MDKEKITSFQVDSEIIKNYLLNNNNYLIEFNPSIAKEYCIVYFSSNDLYYPNSEIEFKKTIIAKNRYEWYENRVDKGHKHIFIRDIQKQWYLGGINSEINTPTKLYEFLLNETHGYKTIFVGSSAGGFASVIFGQLLQAEQIFSFNGQFEIFSLIKKSNETIDPLILRNQNNLELIKYYDTLNFIKNTSSIFYVHSLNSPWDIEQKKHINSLPINIINFNTDNHGLPFYRFNLRFVLNLSVIELKGMTKNIYSPFLFSVKLIGLTSTVINYCNLSIKYFIKLMKRKLFRFLKIVFEIALL
jgi:hypothetical protein